MEKFIKREKSAIFASELFACGFCWNGDLIETVIACYLLLFALFSALWNVTEMIKFYALKKHIYNNRFMFCHFWIYKCN